MRFFRAAVRTVDAEQADLSAIVAEQCQVFTENLDRERRAADRLFLRQCHRLPVTPQQFAGRRTAVGLGQLVVFFAANHAAILIILNYISKA